MVPPTINILPPFQCSLLSSWLQLWVRNTLWTNRFFSPICSHLFLSHRVAFWDTTERWVLEEKQRKCHEGCNARSESIKGCTPCTKQASLDRRTVTPAGAPQWTVIKRHFSKAAHRPSSSRVQKSSPHFLWPQSVQADAVSFSDRMNIITKTLLGLAANRLAASDAWPGTVSCLCCCCEVTGGDQLLQGWSKVFTGSPPCGSAPWQWSSPVHAAPRTWGSYSCRSTAAPSSQAWKHTFTSKLFIVKPASNSLA